MAGNKVFLKQGFELVAEEDRFGLVARRLREGAEVPRFREGGEVPRFRNISENRARYPGLHVVYAAQCPLLPKSVEDLREVAAAEGLALNVTPIQSAEEAQEAPSYHGVFSLLWNGRLLSDHYVSTTRFRNILKTLS